MDFEDYSGQSAVTLPADDWVAGARVLFTGLDATQHVMSNPIVDIEGDTAVCKMYMKAEHFFRNGQGSDDYAIGGYYTDKLCRIDNVWQISAVTLKLFWQRGNRHIMSLARERGAERLGLKTSKSS